MTDKPTPTDAVALARYKVVPAHESMFHRFAVVAGDGKQQLYLGREVECENMARKFAGAFLDGAFYQANITPSTQVAEPVAWLRNTTDQIADHVADNWPMRKYDLSEIEQRLRMLAAAPSGPARVQLTDGQIQDLLLCGNPTDEEMRLIRIGWDAAHGIKGGQP